MSRAQSQYLRIYDSSTTTLHRWQSYYAYRPVTWEGQQWDYMPFTADGFTSGVTGDEANVTVSAPATQVVSQAFQKAIYEGLFIEMRIYDFNANLYNLEPTEEQNLVGAFNGQVIGGFASVTMLTLQLGSALSPVGSQFPPRKLTTEIMGVGCKL
jgi:phage-related protein